MAKQRMTDRELVGIIRAHREDSLGVEDGELSSQRAKAMDRYHGRPYGNEVEGRSQVVDRSLHEAVDWVMPALMRVFLQSGRLAEFDPVGPEDEQAAQQESDYVDRVMMHDNEGFITLHDAVKDTLLLKNGYTKEFWEEEDVIEEESYENMTMDQINMVMQELQYGGQAQVEVIGAESRETLDHPSVQPDPQTGQPMPVELWDMRLKIKKKCGKGVWLAVPTEEIRVSKKCRGSLRHSPFVEHVTRKTRSDLIEMGMPQAFVESLAAKSETNGSQEFARDSVEDESNDSDPGTGDPSMDEIEYCESYLKVDWDGDGVAELRKVVTVSDKIPPGPQWNEVVPECSLTGWVAKRVPHRHVGESLHDELEDIQEILTVLKRQLLDNIYRTNYAETVIDSEVANVRDFLTSTPGGIKRVKGAVQSAVMPMPVQTIVGQIMPVIDFIEASKETRTGINKAMTGLDPDTLQNTTKGAFLENLNRASQKVEMIARMLAETGLKESVLKMHGVLMRHQDAAKVVRLRGQWVPINPREWKRRSDLTLKVGLGTGNEEDKRAKLGMLQSIQTQLMATLMGSPPEVYRKAYMLFEDLAKTLGAENPAKYAVSPDGPEYGAIQQFIQQQQQSQQQPPNQLAEAEQIKAQAAIQIAQAKQEAQIAIEQARQGLQRDKEMMLLQERMADREAERRHSMLVEQMKQMHEDGRAAMREEMRGLIEGMKVDLGQVGIGAGVQGGAGEPIAAIDAAPADPAIDRDPEPLNE